MPLSFPFLLIALLMFVSSTIAQTPGDQAGTHQHHHHHHDQHTMDADGMVMNENTNQLPKDCDKIASGVQITVRAGRTSAQQSNGTVLGYDQLPSKEAACCVTSENGRCRRAQR